MCEAWRDVIPREIIGSKPETPAFATTISIFFFGDACIAALNTESWSGHDLTSHFTYWYRSDVKAPVFTSAFVTNALDIMAWSATCSKARSFGVQLKRGYTNPASKKACT
jgi:hypothetical protein